MVVNPPGDLRIAAAEGDAVERRLAELGIASRRLSRAQATETAVLDALDRRPGLLQVCGHGLSDLLRPERSALLVSPRPP